VGRGEKPEGPCKSDSVSTKTLPGNPVVIIGGGFTGLSAGYELARLGIRVVVLEQDKELGGLAGSFVVNGRAVEKFYHHWFTSDVYVTQLVKELGVQNRVVHRPTHTGIYFAQDFFNLSTPGDLLRFTPLGLQDRLRLGLLAIRARAVRDWRDLEHTTAEEWLSRIGGQVVYKLIWEPLLRGKFGSFAPEISAVWFWNKLKLRGGSRNKRGAEVLAYYSGGFASLAERIAEDIIANGGEIQRGVAATSIVVENGSVQAVQTSQGTIPADAVIATPALPIIADILGACVAPNYTSALRKIDYLANVCLVLELDRSLSNTYWLNVADPHFPFVGVIEHTNFEPSESYGGRHIVYLSKYLSHDSEFYRMTDHELLAYSLPFLQKMFPEFDSRWILQYHVWRARYSQPVVTRGYGKLVPEPKTPIRGFYIATMAQIYPEDRGTNYAIRDGRNIGRQVAKSLS
jgi:protoporphyrinogen oxidase